MRVKIDHDDVKAIRPVLNVFDSWYAKIKWKKHKNKNIIGYIITRERNTSLNHDFFKILALISVN